jgi:hypothetical protein
MIQIAQLAAVILLAGASIASAQTSGQIGEAVRKDFLACESKHWKGETESLVGVFETDDQSPAPAKVVLHCGGYLNWWKGEWEPSPFTIRYSGKSAALEIPFEEWMNYLRFLPNVVSRATD